MTEEIKKPVVEKDSKGRFKKKEKPTTEKKVPIVDPVAEIERVVDGKFAPGVSGNPSGKSKQAKLTAADKKKLASIVEDSIKDQVLVKEVLKFLMERAEFVSDVFKYFKEFAPYLVPKLASMESKVKVDNTFTIRIAGFEPTLIKAPEATKTIESVVEKIEEPKADEDPSDNETD